MIQSLINDGWVIQKPISQRGTTEESKTEEKTSAFESLLTEATQKKRDKPTKEGNEIEEEILKPSDDSEEQIEWLSVIFPNAKEPFLDIDQPATEQEGKALEIEIERVVEKGILEEANDFKLEVETRHSNENDKDMKTFDELVESGTRNKTTTKLYFESEEPMDFTQDRPRQMSLENKIHEDIEDIEETEWTEQDEKIQLDPMHQKQQRKESFSGVLEDNKAFDRYENFTLASMEKEATTIPEESIPTAETAQSIIDQMTESILTKKTDEGTVMQLRLKPEFLGEVTIRLEETKSGITANIVAEKEIVKTLLGQSNEELTALLAEKNIKIDQLIIESKDMTANHGEDQFSEETFNDFSDNENRREQRETPYSQRGELDTISMEDHKNSEKRIMKEGLNLYI